MGTVPDGLLEQVETWEPDTVAVGVTDVAETSAVHGPVDMILPIASLTKLLTAHATLIAVQDGLIHLDEPAGPEPADGITIRHLLAHASGLPPDEGGPTSPPGERRIYSSHGYELLSDRVAERVGLPFADHLALEVLQPLGMADTRLDGSPAHAATSTVRDLLAFARELLRPRLLEPELHRAATTVAFPGLDGVLPGFGSQSPNDWGLGPEVRGTKRPHWTGESFPPETFGHFGRTGSFLWVDPTIQRASVSLADLDFGAWAIEVWPDFTDAVRRAVA